MTSTEQNLTPYDTGERLEPEVWTAGEFRDHYGKVDFDTEESSTAVTAWVERDPLNPEGYVLRYYTHLSGIRVEEVSE